MFAAGRAFEQVRNGIGYPHLNVKIGATHAGLSVGEDGATHQCNEDLGLMNTIPGMVVLSPSDAAATRAAVKAAIIHDGPVYLRLGRLAVQSIYEKMESYEIGKGFEVREGNDVTIIATGLMTHEAIKASEILKNEGISARVIDIISVKPIDKEIIIKAAKETGCIVTAEEHNILGGLGSIVASVTAENFPVPVKMVGVNDIFGKSGKVSEILEEYGLTAENIVKGVKEVIKKK
jgi:transketolase